MESNFCMNGGCMATSSIEWKRGWALKSGQFATLCYICGSAYENFVFCEKFHLEESGWRECKYCRKHIHCGCIASRYLHHYLESGGVGCLRCMNDLETQLTRTNQILSDIPTGNGKPIATTNPQSSLVDYKINGHCIENPITMVENQLSDPNPSGGRHVKQETTLLTCNSPPQQSSVFSSDAPLGAPNLLVPYSDKVLDGEKEKAVKPSQQEQIRIRIFPKPHKSGFSTGSEAKKGAGSLNLPRYLPKSSDEELQLQLSGDLNSTITPLFEKVLSASDAGRMGRLVLPKACAETYFPPISQSEGLPLRIQDVKGKEWTFQFRFWTNNNSRMYVLEGVAQCLRNMQLRAGDTVLFSEINPGKKLALGYRKAKVCLDVQDPQSFPQITYGETSNSGINGNPHVQTDGFGWHKYEEHGGMINKCSSKRPMQMPIKKSRNIGSKSKRLLINSEDATEMRITWKEAQDLLRPPPNIRPTIVMVENHEFEEYDEPPVFGKRTLFIAKKSGCSYSPNQMETKKRGSCSRDQKVFKKQKTTESEPYGLDALATVAVLEDRMDRPSSEATTKHPRHRPGCTCIVCIQPPSGKGKHSTSCTCVPCMSVKRRFRTLMMKKRKRQEESSHGNNPFPVPLMVLPKDERFLNEPLDEVAETSRKDFDLNFNPKCEEDVPPLALIPITNSIHLPHVETENKDDDGEIIPLGI